MLASNKTKMKKSRALEETLLKRHHVPLSSWERETARGIHNAFGEYRLKIRTITGEDDEVIIQEDCSSIATRVWDCATLTTKWLECQSLQTQQETQSVAPNLAAGFQLKIDPSKDDRPIQVLELGSGMGLLSICLAKMGAAVMSTEYGHAVTHLQKNCEQNNAVSLKASSTTLTSGCVHCRELDWYNTTETLSSLFPLDKDIALFDVIAVTDCSLTEKDSNGILEMIQKYGTPQHTKVIVGLCREREGTTYFVEAAQKLFPEVLVVPSKEYHKDYQTMRHFILSIQL